jgi:hypothetical protein
VQFEKNLCSGVVDILFRGRYFELPTALAVGLRNNSNPYWL